MGIYGFLWGNLIGGWLEAIAYFVILFLRRARLVPEVFGPLWSYGWPLIVTTLAGLAMHQMNRYMMRWMMGDLGPIGTFAVAYQLAQGVNQLVITPFQRIWTAIMFEINLLPERKWMFQSVFKYYALGIALILMGMALLARPLVAILAAPEFAEAAEVLPWLCLAFFFFTMHSLLRVPAMVHQKTISVARTSLLAAGVNFFANLALIPRFGIHGAAFASVITYAIFSILGHLAYRQIENLNFPLRYVVYASVGGTALAAAGHAVVDDGAGLFLQIAVGGGSWLIAAAVVFLGPARPLLEKDSPVRRIIAESRRGGRGRKKRSA